MDEKTIDHPFTPGLKVALVHRPRYGGEVSYRPAMVAKVYKTGKFTLEGSNQQYRPEQWRGKWTAYETGSARILQVELITPELEAEAALSARRGSFRAMQRQIEEAKCPDHPSDELLALMRRVVAALASKQDEG